MSDLEARFFVAVPYEEADGRRCWVVQMDVITPVPIHGRRVLLLDLGTFDTKREAQAAADAELERQAAAS